MIMLRTAVSTVALFGALGAAQAVTVDPFACPGQTDPNAGRTSAVLSNVVAGPPNIYNFNVCNTSGIGQEEVIYLLRDWELPYDAAGQIADIVAPAGWGWAIETVGAPNAATGWDGAVPTWFDPNDDFYDPRYLGLTQVIHFYTCGDGGCYGESEFNAAALSPGEGLEGFGFSSPFGATNAPYQASWVVEPPRSGDPAFPLFGANTPGLRNNAPEPSGLALFALSLGALMAARARRREPDAA